MIVDPESVQERGSVPVALAAFSTREEGRGTSLSVLWWRSWKVKGKDRVRVSIGCCALDYGG